MPPVREPDTEIVLNIRTGGKVLSLYRDELLPLYRALGKLSVHRASNVEWEDREGGWVVRAAHDPTLAIRIDPATGWIEVSRNPLHPLCQFAQREAALDTERQHFWELLPKDQR